MLFPLPFWSAGRVHQCPDYKLCIWGKVKILNTKQEKQVCSLVDCFFLSCNSLPWTCFTTFMGAKLSNESWVTIRDTCKIWAFASQLHFFPHRCTCSHAASRSNEKERHQNLTWSLLQIYCSDCLDLLPSSPDTWGNTMSKQHLPSDKYHCWWAQLQHRK